MRWEFGFTGQCQKLLIHVFLASCAIWLMFAILPEVCHGFGGASLLYVCITIYIYIILLYYIYIFNIYTYIYNIYISYSYTYIYIYIQPRNHVLIGMHMQLGVWFYVNCSSKGRQFHDTSCGTSCGNSIYPIQSNLSQFLFFRGLSWHCIGWNRENQRNMPSLLDLILTQAMVSSGCLTCAVQIYIYIYMTFIYTLASAGLPSPNSCGSIQVCFDFRLAQRDRNVQTDVQRYTKNGYLIYDS